MMRYQTMSTPAGALTMVVSESGAVRAAGFTAEVADLLPLIHPDLREERGAGRRRGPGRHRGPVLFRR